jgi:hypothetical protein
MIYEDGTITSLPGEFYFPGIFMIIGALLMFSAGIKKNGALAAIGGILAIIGPIIFTIILNANIDYFQNERPLYHFAIDTNVFFGQNNTVWNIQWYLSYGFFIPFGAGLLGLVSAGGKS